jgi:hypothetical protein
VNNEKVMASNIRNSLPSAIPFRERQQSANSIFHKDSCHTEGRLPVQLYTNTDSLDSHGSNNLKPKYILFQGNIFTKEEKVQNYAM